MKKISKQEIRESKCSLLEQKFTNGEKQVYFGLEDFYDGDICFSIDYDIEYHTGDSRHGYGCVNVEEVLNVFGFNSYDELRDYLISKYADCQKCWDEIIALFKSKGLEVDIDEEEGFSNRQGFFITNN